MDIDDLRLLNCVSKHGSMNRAAAELHKVQSSVTARIRQIEDELGVSLFVRHSRGVRLSDAGARLLSFSDRIDALFREAVDAVREDGVPKGSLRIGATEPTISLRLPAVIRGYSSRYSAVALTVTMGNSSDLIKQVVDRDLDGAFVAGPVMNPELVVEPMFLEELVLITQSSTRSIDDLRSSDDVKALVLAQGCSYGDLIVEVLKGHGVRHQISPLASFEAIRSCVQSGLGVTLAPKEMLAGAWRDAPVAVHALPAATAQAETVFIRRTDSLNPSALDAFLLLSRPFSNIDG